MFPTRTINEALLKEIDKTTLDDRRVRWKEAIKSAPYTMLTDRQKYATESWKEIALLPIMPNFSWRVGF